MSPSEEQLRAALREGEGPGLDAGVIASRAESWRREHRARRTRLLASAAAAVVVAGIGIGTGLVLANDSTTKTASTSGGNADSTYGSGTGSSAGQVPATASGASCAQSLGPPAATTKSSAGSLVTQPSDSVLLCGYRKGTRSLMIRDGRPVALTLGGAQASQVVYALEHAGEQAVPHNCPTTLENAGLVAVHVGSDPPITIDLGCSRTLYTDTVIKYGWQPPAFVETFLGTVAGG